MKNIETKVSKDKVLTITIDLKKDFGRSKSGKTIIIATTSGNPQIANGHIFLGLNCYKYPE